MPEVAAVRAARPDDVAAVRGVAERAWVSTYGAFLSRDVIDRYVARAYSEIALRRAMAGEGLWVLEHDGRVCGYVRLLVRDGVGRVAALYVAPEAQRRGHGRRLWVRSLGWFRSRRVREVRLTVADANLPARAFYARIGFREGAPRRASLLGEAFDERECVYRLEG